MHLSKKKITVFVIILGLIGFLGAKKYFFAPSRTETAKIEKGTVKEELVLSGEIKAEEHATLTFASSGELDKIYVKEGDLVEKGKILARLDTTNLSQLLEQAEADWRRYQASLDKTYDDVKGHEKDETYTQRETRTVAETNKDKAYRAYVIARKNLDNAILRAPFDGVITNITYPFGDINTTVSERQIEILNPETFYFEAKTDQSEIIKIASDQKITIKLDSFQDKEYPGKVTFIGITPLSGETETNYKIKVKLLNNFDKEAGLKIGMSGDAKIVLSQKDDALFVPSQFINSDSRGKFVRKSNYNNKTYIEVGIEGDDRVEIRSSDIKEGDIVYD